MGEGGLGDAVEVQEVTGAEGAFPCGTGARQGTLQALSSCTTAQCLIHSKVQPRIHQPSIPGQEVLCPAPRLMYSQTRQMAGAEPSLCPQGGK